MTIERQIADLDYAVLAVLDLRDVMVIDYSCADEVVAKLVVMVLEETPHPRFVWFRGVTEDHLDPIRTVLERRNLVAAAENIDGEPLLMGSIRPAVAMAWGEIWEMGRTGAPAIAERMKMSLNDVSILLDELEARSLVIRDGDQYVSLRCVFREAEPYDPPTLDAQ